MRFLLFLACFSLLCSGDGKIKNFVVVMLENNSFDRIFGTLKGVKGLTGKEFNLDLNNKPVFVAPAKRYVRMCNPDHSVQATTFKLFGFPVPNFKQNASMSGFVRWEQAMKKHEDGCNTLHFFNETDLPVFHFLAKQGVLFDQMFASLPGPTWPNRWFTLLGTSGGLTDTGDWNDFTTGRLFKQRSILDQVHDAGMTWKNYFQTTPWELCLSSLLHNYQNLQHFDQFLADAKAGTLPHFSWINPRSGVDGMTGEGSNDGHPSHDLALTDKFLGEIYDAVRSSPQYNETALIVMMDEHGGFYDSVPPPSEGVPAPDDLPGFPVPFKFTRLGLRVPFIVLSPYVRPGSVESQPPPSGKRFSTSQYDHTSVMATFRKMMNMSEGPLTRRDAWSATFEHLFSLSEPRTDAPWSAPAPPPATHFDEHRQALTDLQKEIVDMHLSVSKAEHLKKPMFQGQLHAALKGHFHHALSKLIDADNMYRPLIQAEPGQDFLKPKSIVEDEFLFEDKRLKSRKLQYQGTPFCFFQNGTSVGVQLCRNASVAQNFMLMRDGSIRNDGGQCLTAVRQNTESDDYFGTYTLEMKNCVASLFQSFSYYGNKAPGSENDSCGLMLGDGQGVFTIVERV